MVTSIFDFSDRAADESGFFSISLLSIILAVIGALMACVAILVSAIAKVGLAMAVSLAPLFIASLLFRGTSDLFSSWAKFTLGFALIPLVLAGVMGAIVGIGGAMIADIDDAATLTDARRLPDRGAGRDLPDEPGADDGERPRRHGGRHRERHPRGAPAGRRRRDGLRRRQGGRPRGAPDGRRALLGGRRGPRSRGRDGRPRQVGGAGNDAMPTRPEQKSRERNQKRMANMGRRTSFGDDLEAGRAGVMQFTRERKRERAEARAEKRSATAKAEPPPG